jgi:hypothetical protein
MLRLIEFWPAAHHSFKGPGVQLPQPRILKRQLPYKRPHRICMDASLSGRLSALELKAQIENPQPGHEQSGVKHDTYLDATYTAERRVSMPGLRQYRQQRALLSCMRFWSSHGPGDGAESRNGTMRDNRSSARSSDGCIANRRAVCSFVDGCFSPGVSIGLCAPGEDVRCVRSTIKNGRLRPSASWGLCDVGARTPVPDPTSRKVNASSGGACKFLMAVSRRDNFGLSKSIHSQRASWLPGAGVMKAILH